jgi:hypothetical protein
VRIINSITVMKYKPEEFSIIEITKADQATTGGIVKE